MDFAFHKNSQAWVTLSGRCGLDGLWVSGEVLAQKINLQDEESVYL